MGPIRAGEATMQIDVRSVRYAQALATHGSISKASSALGIAQPTLSRCLKDLEIRIGLPLFTRHRHGVEPTDFGHVFLDQATRVVAQIADLEREVELARGLKSGEVTLGVGPYVAESLMPACIRKFSADHPDVRLRIQMDAPDLLGRALRGRAIDIAVAEGSVLEQDTSLEVVERLAPPLPGCFVARATHPLRSKAAVTMTDLFAYPFAQVTSFPPRILKPMLAQRARIRGELPPFPSIECPSFMLAKCAILESDAVTVATLVLIEKELRAGQLAPILEQPWMRSNWVIFKLRGRSLGPAALVLIDELRLAHKELVRTETALRVKWLSGSRARRKDARSAPR
jgi:DNA-binding transcriptional LysR family regulator